MTTLQRLLDTDRSYRSLFQRVMLAAVILPHGMQKLLGWFGGGGVQGTLDWFASALHVPAPIAALVIASDFFGSILLIAGAFTRVAAFGATATMLGAVLLFHAPNGFFMNWAGVAGAGEGFELHLLALGLSVPLMLRGGGAYSLDTALARWLATPSVASSSERVAA